MPNSTLKNIPDLLVSWTEWPNLTKNENFEGNYLKFPKIFSDISYLEGQWPKNKRFRTKSVIFVRKHQMKPFIQKVGFSQHGPTHETKILENPNQNPCHGRRFIIRIFSDDIRPRQTARKYMPRLPRSPGYYIWLLRELIKLFQNKLF